MKAFWKTNIQIVFRVTQSLGDKIRIECVALRLGLYGMKIKYYFLIVFTSQLQNK